MCLHVLPALPPNLSRCSLRVRHDSGARGSWGPFIDPAQSAPCGGRRPGPRRSSGRARTHPPRTPAGQTGLRGKGLSSGASSAVSLWSFCIEGHVGQLGSGVRASPSPTQLLCRAHRGQFVHRDREVKTGSGTETWGLAALGAAGLPADLPSSVLRGRRATWARPGPRGRWGRR